MSLDAVAPGTRVFVDSTIFIYHFTGASPECRAFLERCERREVKGLTSALVLAEVAHRLMMLEAVTRGLVSPGNVARKLRERPEVVRQLDLYQEQVERIPLMGVDVVPLGLATVMRSGEVRKRHGLMVNDSLLVAALRDLGVTALASADTGFQAVEGLTLLQPRDLS